MFDRGRLKWAAGGMVIGLCLWQVDAIAAQAVARTVAPTPAEMSWSAWLQSIVNLMKVLELGTFVFSAYQFWAGRRERIAADAAAAERAVIDSNYQAWQLINSAQGKGGSGGRIEALCDLLRNGVSLAGISLDHAWLEDVQLPRAQLMRGTMRHANLQRANLAGANLEGVDLSDADLVGANLAGAYLRGANLSRARLSATTLDGADLMEVVGWRDIKAIGQASIERVRSAPAGFTEFALERGAVNADTAEVLDDDDSTSFSREFRAI